MLSAVRAVCGAYERPTAVLADACMNAAGLRNASETTGRLRKQLQAAKWTNIADREQKSQAMEKLEVANATAAGARDEVAVVRKQVSLALQQLSSASAAGYKHAAGARNTALFLLLATTAVLVMLWLAGTSLGVMDVVWSFGGKAM